MASILKIGRCKPICSCTRTLLSSRLISTSKKNRETSAVATTAEETACKTEKKNWVSFGFNIKDEATDRATMHMVTFMIVSVVFVGCGTMLAYRPDDLGKDWAQREAFLELRKRERDGLPLIDPNLIPLDHIKLPSDEELGDIEIII